MKTLIQNLIIVSVVLTSVASDVLSTEYFVESGGFRPKTASERLDGFSGNYGLGGNLGGLTLNDIAYDLRDSFTEACHDVGINLGLPLVTHSHGYKYSQVVPQTYGTAVDLSAVIAATKSDDYGSEVLLTSGTAGYKSSPYQLSDYQLKSTPEYLRATPMYYKPRPIYVDSSDGHISSPDKYRDLSVAPTYAIETGGQQKVSGYSAHIIHPAKPGSPKPYGESRVHFTKLHTTPSKLIVAPTLIKRTISEPSVVNGYQDLSPFTHEYPGAYKSTITHKYGSQLTGGYGSHLTGSYGSMLTNGYRRSGLLSDGGLKGLQYSYVHK